jgi:hypothetical protein
VTAATVTELRFDVTAAIHREYEAAPGARREDVVDAVLRQLPSAVLVELARVQLRNRVGVIEQQITRKNVQPAASPRPAPAPSPKVTAIRDDWRTKLRSYEFEGALAARTTLVDATRADLEAASQRHARNAAFLQGIASALVAKGVDRVRDLPVSIQQSIAEKMPRRAT